MLVAEPPRASRARAWSSIAKKIWETIHPRKSGYDVTLRTLRVEVSRNKFLPSPLLCQKALEMIDKSESIYWANVW